MSSNEYGGDRDNFSGRFYYNLDLAKPDREVAVFYLASFFEKEPISVLSLLKLFCKKQGYSFPTSPIEQLIDEASGYQNEMLNDFSYFFFESVVLRVVPNDLIIYQREDIPKLLQPIK